MSETQSSPDRGDAGDVRPKVEEGQPTPEPDTQPAPVEPEEPVDPEPADQPAP
jgi:hypothetical protein